MPPKRIILDERLYVQVSTIPGAGQGLFTLVPIRSGAVIGEYVGETLPFWAAALSFIINRLACKYTSSRCFDYADVLLSHLTAKRPTCVGNGDPVKVAAAVLMVMCSTPTGVLHDAHEASWEGSRELSPGTCRSRDNNVVAINSPSLSFLPYGSCCCSLLLTLLYSSLY
jgi:hypothetical protein